MTETVIQSSFNSGEWSPKLFARVDITKYRSGAALLENFFVDYRGGASTRPGTEYILQCYKSVTPVRIITFQASFAVGYLVEIGNGYMRFFFQGAPVLETAKSITSAAAGPPEVFTSNAHGYLNGDWIFAANKYYIIANKTANTYTLTDLFGVAINTNPFTLPTNSQRVYTIAAPYTSSDDLRQIKFAQNVNQMILCHPNHAPQKLTLITATNWTIGAITFGASVSPPGAITVTTSLGAGAVNYAYFVTVVDSGGNESLTNTVGNLLSTVDIRFNPGTINLTWVAVAGAASYNVYKTNLSYVGGAPAGAVYGFIGNTTGISFNDSNIEPDFATTIPIGKTPFAGNNPTVPGFYQQRLVLAGSSTGPQTFYMSKTGDYFNYNVSQVSQATDAITASLVSGQLNTIRSMVPQQSGLLIFTDRNSWLVNGGTTGTAVAPDAISANPQSFNGVSDVPPIIANFDILYVQSKGSIVRDSSYNIYANVYTGADISAISSHLFYGYTIDEWAWAEEPFKVVWAIRSDGTMLTLTFLKEQEFVGWAHSVTDGAFNSVSAVVESTITAGEVDAIYTVVERSVQGQTLQYVERIVERTFTNGVEDAWCVDCGIGYSSTPATSFSGADFLAGLTVTGLADGVVIDPFVMPANGNFTLSTPASKVTIGIGFTCKLQTLPLELGDPTVQGKVKKINYVDVRVADTLGLSIGSDFDNLVPMKDLIVGNVSSTLTGQASQIVSDLVNGDAQTILDPTYTIPGQYCIEQTDPLPATILGVIPNITVGDGGRK